MTLALSARYSTRDPNDTVFPTSFEFLAALDNVPEAEKFSVAMDIACDPHSTAMTKAAAIYFGQLTIISRCDPTADLSEITSVNHGKRHIKEMRADPVKEARYTAFFDIWRR